MYYILDFLRCKATRFEYWLTSEQKRIKRTDSTETIPILEFRFSRIFVCPPHYSKNFASKPLNFTKR